MELLATRKDENAFVVLVSGEHHGVTTGRGALGMHCSLVHVGEAYEQIVDHVGRDNIVVIAQLQETLDWLTEAARTGQNPDTSDTFTKGQSIEESKASWTWKLEDTRRRCARLIADGGADYDFADVNPSTVLCVLRGEQPVLRGKIRVKKWDREEERRCNEAAVVAAAAQLEEERQRQAQQQQELGAAGAEADGESEAEAESESEAEAEVDSDGFDDGEYKGEQAGVAAAAGDGSGAEACVAAAGDGSGAEGGGVAYGQSVAWEKWLYPGGSGKVVPFAGGRSVVVAVFSHGWSHSAVEAGEEATRLAQQTVCDVCNAPHTQPPASYGHDHSSLSTREWFFNMPYACPPAAVASGIYDAVAHSVAQRPFTLVYWQQLFATYHAMLEAAPTRPLVALYNFCGSGGQIKFFKREAFRRFYRLHHWPLYTVCSCSEQEGAIEGLFGIWFRKLAQELARQSTALQRGGKRRRGEALTLQALYDRVEAQYYADNPSLLYQQFIMANPCVVCRSFEGGWKRLDMCTVCHRKHMAVPAEERPNVAMLKLRRDHSFNFDETTLQQALDAARGSGRRASAALTARARREGLPLSRQQAEEEVAADRPNQAFQVDVGDRSMLATHVTDLFSNARRHRRRPPRSHKPTAIAASVSNSLRALNRG